jgi:hypothetical protein
MFGLGVTFLWYFWEDKVAAWFAFSGVAAMSLSQSPARWLVYVRLFVGPAIGVTGALVTLLLASISAVPVAERPSDQLAALLIALGGLTAAMCVAEVRAENLKKADGEYERQLAHERHLAVLATLEKGTDESVTDDRSARSKAGSVALLASTIVAVLLLPSLPVRRRGR